MDQKIDTNWFKTELINWRPPESITISKWAESRISLTGHSEEKGPLRLRRTPYLKPIMDSFLDPDVETVVLCKAAQIAGTTAMLAVVGYFAEQEPCPIMICMADQDTATYINRERLKPMFRDSPDLAYLFDDKSFSKGENTLPNSAYIAMSWSSSVAKLASRPMRIIIADEVDKPGYYIATREASPLSLLRDRTVTFNNFKMGILSTPTIETGNITIELNSCDVVYDFHVPCANCGIFQPLRWSREHSTGFQEGFYLDEKGRPRELGQVKWKGGREATEKQIEAAGYECGSCKKLWSTIEKNQAVEKGKMVARKPFTGTARKVGFHVNRLYSLLGHSGDIPTLVRNWIESHESIKKLQGFINSALAEHWKQVVVKADENEILKARTDLDAQTVPENAIALTAGIDPQKYGFWFVVRAWARDYSSWLIHYGFLGSWDDVGNLLFNTRYPIAGSDNKSMGIFRAAIDTGGGKGEHDQDPSMTEAAYWWIRENVGRSCGVWGTKGSARPLVSKVSKGKFIDQTPSGKPLPGGIQLVILDTAQLKDSYHFRLQQAIDGGNNPRSAYLHKTVGVDYAHQIMAEQKVLDESGQQVWKQVKPDNHLFDCECLSMACADPEWIGGGIVLLAKYIEAEEKRIQARQKGQQETTGDRPGFKRPDMAKIRERLGR
jgi:phage terminase large subunit GpA-like protein